MGVLGKLAFWKKHDDINDLGKDLGIDKDFDLNSPMSDFNSGMQDPNPQNQFQKYPSSPAFQSPSFQSQSPQFSSPNFNASLQQTYPPQSPQQQMRPQDDYINQKNLEVISSKLDAVRASLESINQRLANIEAIARGEQENQRRRYY